MSRDMARLAPAAALVLAGCLDPLVGDEPGLRGLVLPAGSEVLSAHDDPTIERLIEDGDGVEGVVPLIHGFAAGQPVVYWDFGPSPDVAAPLFMLVREEEGALVPVDHPTIIDEIPGDPDYSPFWAVLTVKVTDRYDGELLTSFAAVQEAEQLGLIEPPQLQPRAVNCPAVARDVTLEVGGGAEPVAPAAHFFWRGMTVDYYDFGPFAVEPGERPAASPRYVLRREGGEPLSEIVRGVDITGDGDRNDTNDVFPARADQDGFSPLCRTVSVAVAAATMSIDSSGDETMAAISRATDLFDPDAVDGTVIAFDETEDLRNCPQQLQPGAL
jgi:hypothetical protein